MLGQSISLAAQFLQFLGAECLAQQEVTVACRIEAGARMGMQQPWTHAIARQGVGEGFHHGAIEWDIAQDQRMRKMGKAT